MIALEYQTLKISFGSGEGAVFDAERQNKASRRCSAPIYCIIVEAIRHVRWFGAAVVISKVTSDSFQVNESMNEYGNLLYDFDSDAYIYKVGMDGDHLMGLFQCYFCVFCAFYHRNPIQV